MKATPKQIRKFAELEQRRVVASRDRDSASLSALLHKDLVFIHSNGRVDARSDYLDLLESGALVYAEMRSRDTDVCSVGDTHASVLTHIDLIADYLGKRVEVSALVLTNWVKSSGRWRALSIQSTPVPALRESSQ